MNALQIIGLRAPQWSTDSRLTSTPSIVDYARALTNTTVFGNQYETAVALRVLHIFAVEAKHAGNPGTGSSSGGGYAGGALTGEQEGSLSKSFATPNSALSSRWANLTSTAYGLELIDLTRGCIFNPRNRMMSNVL